MKLTTRGRYAVMAMADLALFKDKGPTSLTDISLRQNISLAYLEQIFIKLKNKNLVRSVRGAKGGYVLQNSPDEIKISNIISAVDEEVDKFNVSYTTGGVTLSASQFNASGVGNTTTEAHNTGDKDRWALSATFAF